ncbi:hypothetical protein K440DRAFT_601938 [Wilcoxina mikolae CBS 423.85]|nr:hypothetical protein K440DRAFT_601938 [Wilcoxina mikolae CBS 423.85]
METFINSAVPYAEGRTLQTKARSGADITMPDANTEIPSPTSTVGLQQEAAEDDAKTTVLPLSRPTPPADDGGLGVLGGGMRDMVDLVNRLRASGIEDLGLPLPRIAVVGNQSAGKSSLIEAISGIKVPRYSGTCTRCPLEISLSEAASPDQPWSCRIFLRLKKQYEPNRGGNPWVLRQGEARQVHFLDLTDKSEVESALSRAQTAILNPSKNWTTFAASDYRRDDAVGGRGGPFNGRCSDSNSEDNLEVKFSPNVVVMEITAPDLPNLSFIDLPGVIQTTETNNENYLIDLVGGLVEEYVREPDCLILLAMTMKDDAVNQSASRLARDLGEDRTIGALTKPDTVEAGDHEQWINILRGHSHRLRHGYFVTKQPNQDALNKGIDNLTARRQEAEFFRNTPPWNRELRDLRDRFGTPKLAHYLSKELGKLIIRRLPTIIETIESQAQEINEALAGLPAPPSENQVVIVERLLTAFDNEMRQHLSGAPGKNRFQQELVNFVEEFSAKLERTRPQMLPLPSESAENDELRVWRDKLKKRPQGLGGAWFDEHQPMPMVRDDTPTPSFGLMEEGNEDIQMQSPITTPSRKRPHPGEVTPSLSQRRIRPRTQPPSHKYTLPRVRHIIETTSTAGLPNQVDPEAVKNVAKDNIKGWEPKVSEFTTKIANHVGKLAFACFLDVFQRYDKSPICEKAHSVMEEFLNVAVAQHRANMEKLWRLESTQIRTLNHKDYENLRRDNELRLCEKRRRNLEEQNEQRKQSMLGEKEVVPQPAVTPAKGRGRVTKPAARALSPTPDVDESYDHYKREVKVLAEVQAYYDIARKRFIDYVYMSIMGEFLETCKNGLLEGLKIKLSMEGPDAEETCRKLLVEDPEKERRRRELLMKKDQLQRAKDELSVYLK